MQTPLVVVVLALAAGCLEPNVVRCSNGLTCPGNRKCDVAHAACVDADQLVNCDGLADGDDCDLVAIGDGICDQGVCIEKHCGDGYIQVPEQCDGTDIPADADCDQLGFYFSGPLTCNSACGFDTSQCTGYCGDEIITPGIEVCEIGTEVTASCVDFGFGTGALGCENCGADVRECIPFGWQSSPAPGYASSFHGTAADDVWALYPLSQTSRIEHFDGIAWSEVDLTSCNLSGAADLLRETWSPAKGVLFAAGEGSTVIRITPVGCTKWVLFPDSPLNPRVESVWASSETDAWVSFMNEGVWRFDGSTWSPSLQHDFSEAGAAALWGSGPNDVYVVMNGMTVASHLRHFDGNAWSAAIPVPGVAAPVAIWGTSSTNVYVGGTFPVSVTRFDGINWTPLLENHPILGPSSVLHDAITVDGRTYISAGPASSAAGHVLVHDGTGWTNLGAPIAVATRLFAAEAGRVFISLSQTAVGMYHGSGRVDVSPGTSETALAELVAAAPDDAFTVQFGQSKLLHWDGATWTVEADVTDAYGVAVSPTGTVFASSSWAGLWQRNADGLWTNHMNAKGGRVWALADDDVWVADAGFGRVTRWRSPTDATELLIGDVKFFLNDIWVASPSSVFVVGYDTSPGSPPYPAAVRHYNGASWSAMPAPAGVDSLRRVTGTSATNVYAVGESGGLIRYDGVGWQIVALPDGSLASDVWISQQDELFVASTSGLHRYDGVAWWPVDIGGAVASRLITGAGDTMIVVDAAGSSHHLTRLAPW